MERFCRGDEAAFEMLYERHAPAVFGFLQRMMREPALAEDVLQTTFLSVVRARGRYEPDSSVRAWMPIARVCSATPSPLSMTRVRIPRVSSSAASTSPVGPAPITSTWQSEAGRDG